MSGCVYAIATMDTKENEILFVADRLRELSVPTKVVDVGTRTDSKHTPDIRIQIDNPEELGRGVAVEQMGHLLEQKFRDPAILDDCAGVIGIGGSGGTAIVTRLMRSLPIGLPKVMVSTMASGNTAPYVDCSDIMMLYSVVDVAGLNPVLKQVLGNAAAAMAGMVQWQQDDTSKAQSDRSTIGMTMFGVTTPCVTAVREALEAKGYECLVFHATGTGGRAMEKLVESGYIHAVLDITTTDVADEIVGGIMPAGPNRMRTILGRGLPYVVSVGAVDMVNFGGMESVPPEFRDRNLYQHNEHVTLMRTTPEENSQIATWIVDRLNDSDSPFTVVLPTGGVSMLDAPGQPFHDPQADESLFEHIQSRLQMNDNRRLVPSTHHINDPEFAELLVDEFCKLMPQKTQRLD